MLTELGACMIPDRLRPPFQHPVNPDATVHVMLDACHVLKLVRNAFVEGMVATDNDQQDISWHFIENLHKLEKKEGLRLANKLKTGHIEWRKQKNEGPPCGASHQLHCSRFNQILRKKPSAPRVEPI